MFGVSTGPKSSFGPNFPCIAFSSINIKQLLGEGFVISRIINVEVGRRLITLTETLTILDITKTESTLNESFLSRFNMKCFHSLC